MPKDPSIHVLTDPPAIRANQAGRITDEQRAQHKRESLGGEIVQGIFLTLFVVLFIGVTITCVGAIQTGSIPLPFSLFILLLPVFLFLFVGALAFAFVYGLIHDRRLSRELVDGPIAQMEGQVDFLKGMYQALIAGRPLHTITESKALQLPPGTYRFSYLPLNGCILSAERLNKDEPGGPYAGVLQALALSNKFTEEDLTLNRQGLLSDQQRAQMKGNRQDREQDLSAGRVAMVEGIVERFDFSDPGYESSVYEIVAASGIRLRFDVSNQAYQALIPELHYRLYYLPHTGKLASIEPLP